MSGRPFRVLIPFNTTGHLYGLERAVIEIFDLLRPEIEPLFVVAKNKGGPDHEVILELNRRGMETARFSDTSHWPRMGKPRSAGHLKDMARAFYLGNRDILRHAAPSDAIYVPGVGYGSFAVAAMWRCHIRGQRVVHQFHEFSLRPDPQFDLLNRLITDYVHATQSGLSTVAGLNPSILKRRNHVIPLAVELPECIDSPEILAAFAGHRNIVYAGRLCTTKGLDILLDAFDLLASRYPDLRLHLVGSCEGIGSEEIEKRLSTPVEHIRVWGYREDVPAFFRHAYLAVQCTPPSRCRESFGRTAVEAALCGAPVVSFASGALPELVADGVSGTICKEESPQALAAGIEDYLINPARRNEQAETGIRRAREMFSREAIKRSWLECFGLNS